MPKSTDKPKRKDKLTAAKPRSILLRNVTLDVKPFFESMATTVGQIAALEWLKLPQSLAKGINAIGLDTPAEDRAFTLIHRALLEALYNLLNETSDLERAARDKAKKTFREQFSFNLQMDEVEIDEKFFQRPGEIAAVTLVIPILKNWIIQQNVPAAAADTMAHRLPAFFTYALNREWRERRADYEPILKEIDTPFTGAADSHWAWEEYIALLDKRLDESVFDEPFGLRQIFVDLNAFYIEDLDESIGPVAEQSRDRRPLRKTIVRLDDELDKWLQKNDPHDAIRMLRGGPGSGKSAFTRIFAARLARERRWHVLHVPLHLIDADKDITAEIGRFLAAEGIAVPNPVAVETGDPNLVLIFDGLDELASQGKVAEKRADDFVDEVRSLVTRQNQNRFQLRVLLTGRDVAVQQSESRFRGCGQVLALLPYAQHKDGEHGTEKFEVVDPAKLLKADARDEWWPKYGILTGQDYSKQLKKLKEGDLGALTVQPLLNFLVAFSFSGRKKIATEEMGRAKVYANLIGAVYTREYEHKRPIVGVETMTPQGFHRMLEEIGLAAWHGDGRSTTITEVIVQCQKSGLEAELERFKGGAEKGVTRLLAAFFFRQQGSRKHGDATFVFTHKSFGEYLAACRIIQEVVRIQEECTRRKEGKGGWNAENALEHWCAVCGPSGITWEFLRFLRSLVEDAEIQEVIEWQATLTDLFKHMFRNGMPMERLRLDTFGISLRQSRNAEEALLALLNACAKKTDASVDLQLAEKDRSFSAWLKRIADQNEILVNSCLSLLDLKAIALYAMDFYRADLERANLERANLHGAFLFSANLSGANLSGANLGRADLYSANLFSANLSGAYLERADLGSANLSGANLSGANLERADLGGADLERANLSGANLSGADLKGADLKGANFEHAILVGADLRTLNLKVAHYAGANFKDAQLPDGFEPPSDVES